MGLIVSLFNNGGRLVFGTIFDKFGRNVAFILNSFTLLSSGLCLFAALQTGQATLMFVGLSLVGLSYGGSPAISSAATSTFWGTKYYSANFSYINCTLIPAAILGPMISSALQEQAGGAYDSTFVMLTAFGVTALLAGIFLLKEIAKTTSQKTFSEVNQ
jgi:OFA family oxalate/formate antiporter-like MFS transporter